MYESNLKEICLAVKQKTNGRFSLTVRKLRQIFSHFVFSFVFRLYVNRNFRITTLGNRYKHWFPLHRNLWISVNFAEGPAHPPILKENELLEIHTTKHSTLVSNVI